MEQTTLWKRLRKHYILVLIGLIVLLLFVSFGVYKAIQPQRATPIAYISVEDSLKTTTLPGKLERYKKELIEQEKQAYRRKVAMEQIVSMDFSQEMKLAKKGMLKDTPQGEKPTENISKIQRIQNGESVVADRAKKPLIKKSTKAHFSRGERKSDENFYTIKKDSTNNPYKRENAFVKALIHGNQKIKGGGKVCLRLVEEAAFGGNVLPRNTILYARISGAVSGRIRIVVSQVKEAKVNLSVYDQDYVEGIAYQMSETISEVATESRDEALNEVLSSLPYGGVAGGLAQLGRNVARKTKRPNTIYLADGYEVFIANAKK
jgi:hypothetical protein